MTWLSIIIAGTLTYLTRMTMIALINRDMLGDRIKAEAPPDNNCKNTICEAPPKMMIDIP